MGSHTKPYGLKQNPQIEVYWLENNIVNSKKRKIMIHNKYKIEKQKIIGFYFNSLFSSFSNINEDAYNHL